MQQKHSELANNFDSDLSVSNSFFDSDAVNVDDTKDESVENSFDENYSEFDSELGSEHFDQDHYENFLGIGKKNKEKRQEKKAQRLENRVEKIRNKSIATRGETQARQIESQNDLSKTAADIGTQQSVVALSTVEANKPLIQDYVQQNGQVPQQNNAALAVQATKQYINDVEDKQNNGVPDWDAAQESVIEDYKEEWGEDADNFFGSVLTSVFSAGGALVAKINKNRTDAGKNPLFAGKGWEKIAKKIADNKEVVTDAMTANEKAFIAITKKEIDNAKKKDTAIAAATGAFVSDQKRQAVKEYLPVALLVLVFVFVIGKTS